MTVAFTATLYNKIFLDYQPCQLVKWRKKPTFQGPSLSSSSGLIYLENLDTNQQFPLASAPS
jgi:hypothetical protein